MQKITCRVPPLTKAAKLAGEITKLPRLDHAIATSREGIAHKLTRAMIRKLIVAGAVYVNGKRMRIATKEMQGGEIIDIYYNSARAPETMSAEKFLPLRVLYEDNAVICFDKPPALPAHPTLDDTRANLFELAKQQLSTQAGKAVYLGMHHRLDRDTSGVMLFTREEKHNAHVADQFKSHKCQKVYVAVVHGKLKQSSGKLESFLGPVSKKGKQSKFGSVHAGGKKAITSYHVLSSTRDFSLVEVSIATGRTHQIRVHLSEMGHPIVGDTLYGSPEKFFQKTKRHLLHAYALSFEHPVTHGNVRVESPVPQEFRKWVLEKP